MQLVLSNNRIIAHGENFLSLGGVVINTETGAKYENATIAECEGGCPSDINEVGYEYHAGVFVPCAPFGKGNNNGNFMEVCETCATPRNSGIPIKETMELIYSSFKRVLLWENASPSSEFRGQTITLTASDYTYLMIEVKCGVIVGYNSSVSSSRDTTDTVPNFITFIPQSGGRLVATGYCTNTNTIATTYRDITTNGVSATFTNCYDYSHQSELNNYNCVPLKIYGVKL